jgi:hypothetical protein
MGRLPGLLSYWIFGDSATGDFGDGSPLRPTKCTNREPSATQRRLRTPKAVNTGTGVSAPRMHAGLRAKAVRPRDPQLNESQACTAVAGANSTGTNPRLLQLLPTLPKTKDPGRAPSFHSDSLLNMQRLAENGFQAWASNSDTRRNRHLPVQRAQRFRSVPISHQG